MAGTILLLGAKERRVPPFGEGTAERQVLFDYFAAELFDQAPADVQRLLLSTALLPDVDVRAAETLSGEPRAGEILADLVRRSYFTIRLAGAQPRYRFHSLLREFLLARARAAFGVEAWRTLARRTARSLVDEGAAETAAGILMEVGCHDALAALVRDAAPALAAQGQLASIARWLAALPAAALEEDPWLSYWAGACHVVSPQEARPHLDRAYRTFRERGDLAGALVAWAAFVTTYMYVWDEFGGLDPWIADLEELRARQVAFGDVNVEAQVTFAMLAALMWRAPDHPSVDHWVERATALVASQARTELRVQLAAYLSFYWTTWRGDLSACDGALARLRTLVDDPGVTPLTQVFWDACEAHQRARRGDSAACFAAVEHGLQLVRRTGVLGLHGLLATQGIYGALFEGDLDSAHHYYAVAQTHGAVVGKANRMHHLQLGAWIALCAGDLPAAEANCRAMSSLCETGIATAWAALTEAHVAIQKAELAQAESLLERCLEWGRRVRDSSVRYHALLSLAHARLVGDRPDEALPFLDEGLRLGRAQGYVVHPWIGWRREVMARLAAVALEHGIEPDHVRAVIRANRLERPRDAAFGSWPRSIQIQALGGFAILRDGARVRFGRKVPRKPLELLRLLVVHGEGGATLLRLAEALWPDADGDVGQHVLETTVYRLRRHLGDPDAVARRGGRVALDPERVFVDAWAFEALARRARAPGGAAARAAARSLYRGELLPDDDLPGVASARERLCAVAALLER